MPCTWAYPDLDSALRGLISSGPAVQAIETSGEEAVRAAVATAVEPFGQPSGGYAIGSAFRDLIATA
ncbi:MAG: hypothetical protein M3065_08585 [Actinomycetota bacterium]|nr:hypothetical protein [Actinomycetota bacterium]